jgi:hypothetical protein
MFNVHLSRVSRSISSMSSCVQGGKALPKRKIGQAMQKWEYMRKEIYLSERLSDGLFCPLSPVLMGTAICEREILRFRISRPPAPMPPRMIRVPRWRFPLGHAVERLGRLVLPLQPVRPASQIEPPSEVCAGEEG